MPRGIALKEIGAWYEAPFLFLRTKHERKPWNNLRPLQSNKTKSKLPGFLHYLPRTSHLPFHPYTDKCLKIIARVLGKKSQKCQGSLSNHPDSYNSYYCHMSLTDPNRPDHFKRCCMMFLLVSGDQGWVAWILNILLGGFMSHLGQHARQKHLHCLVPPIDFHHLKEDHVISLYNVQGDLNIKKSKPSKRLDSITIQLPMCIVQNPIWYSCMYQLHVQERYQECCLMLTCG